MMVNWSNLWIQLFGTTTWFGINVGFWISMGISAAVAIAMVAVFWSLKPYEKKD